MSRDIRSYFNVLSDKKAKVAEKVTKPKKRLVIVSSDDSDDGKPNPKAEKIKVKKVEQKKIFTHTLSDSDDDEKVNKTKRVKLSNPPKEPEKKLKTTTLESAFGNVPVKRKEIPKKNSELKNLEEEIQFHDDDKDFEDALFEINFDSLVPNSSKNSESNENRKRKIDNDKIDENASKKSKLSDEKIKDHDVKKKKTVNDKNKNGSTSGVSKLEVIPDVKSPKKKEKEKKEEVLDMFDEIKARKKKNAAAYQNYLNRGGARNPGSKKIPEGAENCLQGLTFVVTGVLESLEREEAEELIKKYSGRVVHAVSKKTNYVVVGEEPGQSKLTKAELYKIQQISEDDLLELIRSKSDGKEVKRKEESVVPDKKVSPKNKPSTSNDVKHKKITVDEVKLKKIVDDDEKPKKPSPKRPSPKKQETHKNDSKDSKVSKVPEKAESSKLNDTKENSPSNITKLSTNCNSLVEKYRPTKLQQIVGQHTDNSCAKRLYKWLSNWDTNRSKQHKKAVNGMFAKKEDALFKAALLSGSPGIGKTTTVQVVCKELGYDLIEFNASDTRNKTLLKDQVSSLLSNKTVKGYFMNDKNEKTTKKHVLLMDEVDGMAGNEDRGGLQELISLIKNSDTPIICICNDRNNPKMRTLVNYTADICFPKPKLEQIRGAMRSICCKENIQISKENLDNLIESTNHDIRQIINHLSMFTKVEGAEESNVSSKLNKDIKLGPWDVVRKVFSSDEHKKMSIHDKSNLFFHDYNIGGLFVYENYPNVQPVSKIGVLKSLAKTADSLSLGDMVENAIRKNNAWSLLPTQACFSSVIPGTIMSGQIKARINFPSWLGRNSRTGKFDRLLQEITVHTRLTTKSSKEAINLDYIRPLRDSITRPLAVNGTEGVKDAVEVMNAYHLLREDLDSLVEVSLWSGQKDPMQGIDSQVKAAFTRAYNKNAVVTPFSISNSGPKKKNNQSSQDEGFIEDEENVSEAENEDDDNLDNDKMVKAKKPSASKEKASGSKQKATTSKRGRGRGK